MVRRRVLPDCDSATWWTARRWRQRSQVSSGWYRVGIEGAQVCKLQCLGDVGGGQYADHSAGVVDDNSAPVGATMHALQEIDNRLVRMGRRNLARRAGDFT